MPRSIRLAVALATALVVPVAAQAYIGPGVGAGAIAAVLGVLGAIFLGIVAVLYYPIKRLLKRKRSAASRVANSGK